MLKLHFLDKDTVNDHKVLHPRWVHKLIREWSVCNCLTKLYLTVGVYI